jgi:hypothetical protein
MELLSYQNRRAESSAVMKARRARCTCCKVANETLTGDASKARLCGSSCKKLEIGELSPMSRFVGDLQIRGVALLTSIGHPLDHLHGCSS